MSHSNGGRRTRPLGYRDIAAEMQRRLQHGAWTRGALLPSERELCAEFQTTRTTLRRAFAVLERSGWLINVPSRGMVAGDGPRRAFGRLIARLDAPDLENVSHAARLMERLAEHGLTLVEIEGEMSAAPLAAAISFDGHVVPHVPTVSLGVPGSLRHSDSVAWEHARAAYDATQHLIRCGARRIAVTGALDGRASTHLRYQGYLQALREAGHVPSPTLAPFLSSDLQHGMRTEGLVELLRSPQHPDALLILQAECAEVVISTVVRMGYAPPHDLRLITIGRPTPIAVGEFGISSVEFDAATFMEHAVLTLLQRIHFPERPRVDIAVPHILRLRGLCGADAGEWCDPNPAASAITRYIVARSQ